MNYDIQRPTEELMWRSCSKSLGVITAPAYFAITLSPTQAGVVGLGVWVAFVVVHRLFLNLYDMNIWAGCGTLVIFPVSFWIIRRIVVGICGFIAFQPGVPHDRALFNWCPLSL